MVTRVPVSGQVDPTTMKQTWSGLLNGDDGAAVKAYEHPDK